MPAPRCGARPSQTKSPSACLASTDFTARRSIRARRIASPAARRAARLPLLRAASSTSRSAPTPAGRCASPQASAASTACGLAGSVLLGEQVVDALSDEIIVASDCFGLADEPVRHALLPALDRLRRIIRVSESLLADGDLTEWSRHQRLLQKSEFHATFRDWIDRVNPRFSAEVAGAFADDGRIPSSDLAAAKTFREYASKRLDD